MANIEGGHFCNVLANCLLRMTEWAGTEACVRPPPPGRSHSHSSPPPCCFGPGPFPPSPPPLWTEGGARATPPLPPCCFGPGPLPPPPAALGWSLWPQQQSWWQWLRQQLWWGAATGHLPLPFLLPSLPVLPCWCFSAWLQGVWIKHYGQTLRLL